MSRTQGQRWTCEACGVQLIGAVNTQTGKVAPIEAAPSENGNVLLQRHADGMVVAITFGPQMAEGLRERHIELRLNHFASCPERERFERNKTTNEGTGTA